MAFSQKSGMPFNTPVQGSLNRPDSLSKLQLRSVIIIGNKRTKDYIIMREIHFKPGDSIIAGKLLDEIEIARQQIHNTTLFAEVKADPVMVNAFEFDLVVAVREKWYIYPTPQFQLVDRNLNEWLVKYNGSLSRVNYGLKFVHYNLSGRKDQLRIQVINGYSRNVSAAYVAPYSNSKLTQGFSLSGGFSQFREVAYRTNYDNSFARFNNGNFVYDNWYINAGFQIRKAIKKRHLFNLSYSHINILDTIISSYNTKYFNSKKSVQGIVDLAYTFQYVSLDNVLYPTKGESRYITLIKRGTGISGGINMFSIEAETDKFISLGKKWFISYQLLGKIKLPFDQPYINQRGLGFGNAYLRGQEYFIIDAVAFALAKTNLSKQIANFYIPTPFKAKVLSRIPFRIYAKTFADFGYAYNKKEFETRLNNKFLYSGGFGIDIITFFDLQMRFEYSFNQLGQKGLFLHNQSGF